MSLIRNQSYIAKLLESFLLSSQIGAVMADPLPTFQVLATIQPICQTSHRAHRYQSSAIFHISIVYKGFKIMRFNCPTDHPPQNPQPNQGFIMGFHRRLLDPAILAAISWKSKSSPP